MVQVSVEVDSAKIIKPDLDGKGRVTIPKKIRDELGLERGDSIEIAIVESQEDTNA